VSLVQPENYPVDVHDIRHVIPPFPDNRICRQPVGCIVILKFLDCKERKRFFIQEDGIVVYAGFGKFAGKFRPDLIVTPFIFLFEARLQFHFERYTFHDSAV
jgi:hypothetical protein